MSFSFKKEESLQDLERGQKKQQVGVSLPTSLRHPSKAETTLTAVTLQQHRQQYDPYVDTLTPDPPSYYQAMHEMYMHLQ